MAQDYPNAKKPLPLSVIHAAQAGHADAVDQVLRFYEGYINKLCTRKIIDATGRSQSRVDQYMRNRLEIKLIHSIVDMD